MGKTIGIIFTFAVIFVIASTFMNLTTDNSCESWKHKIESVCGATVVGAGGTATVDDIIVNNDASVGGLLDAATGRGATITVATSNSTALETAQADYVLTGTNDNVILQTAINAASGGTLIIYSGTATLTTTVTVPSHTDIIMMPTTKLRFANGVADSSRILSFNGVIDVDVYGGIIDGNKAGQAVKANNLFGVYIAGGSSDINFYSTKFMDCGRSGTLSGYNYYATASGTLSIHGGASIGAERHNICFYETTGPYLVEGVYIADGLYSNIDSHTAPNGTINNCILENSRNFGLLATAGSDGLIVNGLRVNNSADDNVYLDDVDDAKITNLISDQAGDYGLRAKTCLRLDLSHSDIKNSADNGVFLDTGCDYSKITNNYFYGNKTYGVYTTSPFTAITGNHFANNDNRAICLWTTANDALIAGNTFDDGTDQDYIIQTKTTATWPVRVMVRDNDFTGGALVAVWYNAINSDITVRDNIGYTTSKDGTSTGTGAEQTIAHGLVGIPNFVLCTGTGTYSLSTAPDATNIYVTMSNGADYAWYAEMK